MIPITIETSIAPGAMPGSLLVSTVIRCGGETFHSEKLVHRGVSIDALGYLMESQKAALRDTVARFYADLEGVG